MYLPQALRIRSSRRSSRATGEQTGTPIAPRAQRFRSSRRTDVRLWLGLVLIVASMFIGAHLLSRDSPTVTVWQASRDLSIGATPMDLQPVTVALGSVAQDYVTVDEQPIGRLRIPITEGELLPRSALVADTEQVSRIVTIGVEPLHAPIDLAAGDRVDMWSTDEQGSSTGPTNGSPVGPALPTLVLANVLVEAVSVDSMGGQLAVVVRVSPDQVVTVVQAARAGVVDLVSVPAVSQGVSS